MDYVLGMDGGGSKVICLAADIKGQLLGLGSGGPVNTNYVSWRITVDSLTSAINMALAQAGLQGNQIARLCISAPCEPGAVDEAMNTCGIAHVDRAAEGETPCWAARFWIDGHIGVTVDAGTGSLARGWARDGRVASVGGWGGTLGDEGSGYWISLQAMRAVLQAQDGRIVPTHLTQSVLSHYRMSDVLDLVFQATQGLAKPDNQNQYGVGPDSGMGHEDAEKSVGGYCFREFARQRTLSRDEIASLCPVVVRTARQGDWKALEILREAGEELGQLGAAVIKRLGMEADEFAIVPFGGVFRAGNLVLQSFRKTVLSTAGHARVVAPRFEPVVGAVLLAMNALGINITSEILTAIERSSFNYPDCRNTQEGG
jgi:glucosamine kinase